MSLYVSWHVVTWEDFDGKNKKTLPSKKNALQFANELKRNGLKNVNVRKE